MLWRGFLAVALCFVSVPGSVRANGAFADSGVILLSKAQPGRIVASSELPGLVVSDDGGASWHWICESALGALATLFQRGAPPDERLYAITRQGLSTSADGGCSWQQRGNDAQRAGDVFADPNEPARVLVVAQTTLGEERLLRDVLVASDDGAGSFAPPLFSTDDYSITSVESAASDPARLYLALSSSQLQRPYLARSRDGGEHWDTLVLSQQLGRRPFIMRILTVDPRAADRVYLRISDGTEDALAVTRDAGDHVSVVQKMPASMSAFVLRADGSVIVASTDGSAFIARDGADSFEPWPVTLHLRALAEAEHGTLYAATSSKLDGFAFAASHDDGASWEPLLQLTELRGPLACGDVAERCAASWEQQKPSLAALAGQPDAAVLEPSAAVDHGKSRQKNGCSVALRARTTGIPGELLGAACAAGVLHVRRRQRTRALRAYT